MEIRGRQGCGETNVSVRGLSLAELTDSSIAVLCVPLVLSDEAIAIDIEDGETRIVLK